MVYLVGRYYLNSNIKIEKEKSLFYSDLMVSYDYSLLIMITYHLPIQNLLKIFPKISSVDICPVISPR